MMGKLLKYELRSALKSLGVLWIAAFVMLLVNSVSLNYFVIDGLVEELLDNSESILSSFIGIMSVVIPIVLLFITCIAVFLMPFIYIVTRFYKGLLGDEGYLMFTLPVKTNQLVLSKGITAFIIQIISFLISVVPVVTICALQRVSLYDVTSEMMMAFEEIGLSGPVYFIILAVSLILGTAETIFRLYLSMSLGHLAKKHRVAWSVGAYVALNYVISAITACVQLFSACNYVFEQANSQQARYPIEILLSNVICYAIFAAAEYIFTLQILKKRLNLE